MPDIEMRDSVTITIACPPERALRVLISSLQNFSSILNLIAGTRSKINRGEAYRLTAGPKHRDCRIKWGGDIDLDRLTGLIAVGWRPGRSRNRIQRVRSQRSLGRYEFDLRERGV